ncbi:cytochrome B561 [Gluconacetobacter diazotrophicus PA1 5]|uniref:Cytochrome b n=2 Tax=Gluconacetobacter diazotrophicus TaxID=33996 RepID=A0A7W4I5V8_GLUDI|nr:cytochrome b/b6 domain-containing protein [Gluconacetobacter diazotrophicus]ACI52280.1 cytochrome B561 [Gluconacetobacter diazotrophicus PA1 5]MBB2156833.1 cytochrome b [Gluconacetobacter diazotrophicus]TWB04825.1 cytochrome b561 [Gluconacetobacter diazotrophicus]CAP57594.1 putative cytochrome B561 [Gluconacetobacter diazotrophicus PA1 5]
MDGMGAIDPGGLNAAPVRYSVETRWLHWGCAVLILAQFVLGELMHRVPRSLHGTLVSFHLSLGVLLAALFVTRIAWRVTGGRAIRFAARGTADRAAHAVHGVLYVAVGAEIALGYLARWSTGRPVVAFGVPIASPFGAFSQASHRLFGTLHDWLAWGIIILAAGHAAAAVYHARVLRDDVMRRMC